LVRRPLSLRTLFVRGVWTRPGARTVWGDGRVPFGEEFPSAKYLYFLIRKVRTHAGGVIESVRPFLLLAAGGGKTGVFPRWCSIGERDGFSDSSEKQMPWAPTPPRSLGCGRRSQETGAMAGVASSFCFFSFGSFRWNDCSRSRARERAKSRQVLVTKSNGPRPNQMYGTLVPRVGGDRGLWLDGRIAQSGSTHGALTGRGETVCVRSVGVS
jgi:hypothetical protein